MCLVYGYFHSDVESRKLPPRAQGCGVSLERTVVVGFPSPKMWLVFVKIQSESKSEVFPKCGIFLKTLKITANRNKDERNSSKVEGIGGISSDLGL